MPIRILIADDQTVCRTGLRGLLDKESDFQVAGEAATCDQVLEELSKSSADVLLLELAMPGQQSAAQTAEIALERNPELSIVVLTMYEDALYMREMFKVGVRAYVLKKSSADVLVSVIRAAYKGKRYVDPSLGGNALSALLAPPSSTGVELLDCLTPREREVCRLLALGYTNAETASKLSISERTVETHRCRIMGKLDLQSRAELVRFALDHGLVN